MSLRWVLSTLMGCGAGCLALCYQSAWLGGSWSINRRSMLRRCRRTALQRPAVMFVQQCSVQYPHHPGQARQSHASAQNGSIAHSATRVFVVQQYRPLIIHSRSVLYCIILCGCSWHVVVPKTNWPRPRPRENILPTPYSSWSYNAYHTA